MDYRNYIRIQSIRKLFVHDEFTYEHSMIMRILLQDFLNKEAIICFTTSRKATKRVMTYNLISVRGVINEILVGKTKHEWLIKTLFS